MTPEQRGALRRIDRQFEAVRAMPEPVPARERHRHGIEELGVGGYFRAGGELLRVEGLHHYQEKGSRWYELECLGLESGEMQYVEWEKDDEVEISVNGPALSLRDLGVTADQVEEMSDEEEGSISYGGRSYHYDDDYAAIFHRDGDAAASEPVYFYDFETRDERHSLSVEEWGDERSGYDYEAYVSEYLEPDAVEVLLVGEGRREG